MDLEPREQLLRALNELDAELTEAEKLWGRWFESDECAIRIQVDMNLFGAFVVSGEAFSFLEEGGLTLTAMKRAIMNAARVTAGRIEANLKEGADSDRSETGGAEEEGDGDGAQEG